VETTQDYALPAAQKSTNVRITAMVTALRVTAALSPRLAAAALGRLFLTVRRHRTPRRETGWLESARERRVKAWVPAGPGRAEIELPVWTWGDNDRPAVLLVHGWEGRGSQMGAFAAPLVDAGFRVVAYDAPGHGASPGGRSSMPEMTAAVAQVGRWLGGVAGLVAHSAGAAATSAALAADPFPAGRLVYVSPPADPGRFLQVAARMAGLAPEIARQAQAGIEGRFGVRFDDFAPGLLAPRMDLPLLALHDRGDKEVPHTEGARVVEGWPDARMVTTEGLGHRRILRDDGVVQAAVEFLSAPGAKAGRAAA